MLKFFQLLHSTVTSLTQHVFPFVRKAYVKGRSRYNSIKLSEPPNYRSRLDTTPVTADPRFPAKSKFGVP